MNETHADYSIERAQSGDIADLAQLIALLFQREADFSVDTQKQVRGLELLLEEPKALVVCARNKSNSVIGMLSFQLVISTAEGGLSAWLEDLIVAPSWQRRGVAQDMLHYAENWAREKGVTRVQALVDYENLPAFAYYEKRDYRRTRMHAIRKLLSPSQGAIVR